MTTPIVPLKYATFRKEHGVLVLSSEFLGGCFPAEIIMESHHTGNQVRFVQDTEAAIKTEFWDGECMEYIPVGPSGNCNRLVIVHEF